jgi:acetyltransferase-like isoleucine patch superfamily enzyme
LRKITPSQIAVFMLLAGISVALAGVTAWLIARSLPPGDFRGLAVVIAFVLLVYVCSMVVYRVFLKLIPLEEGEIVAGSRAELAAQVNILFYLMLFNSLIRTHFLPVPLMRLVYLGLGAKLGSNTYCAGTLLDPALTEMGANCIVGHDAVLFCHAIEGTHFALARIRTGDNVTIGATAVVMAGVQIGDGGIVSAGAVVPKDTQIGPGEIWGGVPARRLK